MNLALKSSLEKAIRKWSDEAVLEEGWDEVGYVGDNFVSLMTEAAAAVLDAYADVDEYHKREGNLE